MVFHCPIPFAPALSPAYMAGSFKLAHQSRLRRWPSLTLAKQDWSIPFTSAATHSRGSTLYYLFSNKSKNSLLSSWGCTSTSVLHHQGLDGSRCPRTPPITLLLLISAPEPMTLSVHHLQVIIESQTDVGCYLITGICPMCRAWLPVHTGHRYTLPWQYVAIFT